MNNTLNIVLRNIDKGNLPFDVKENLKETAIKLSVNNVPILLTKTQVYELFEVDENFSANKNIRVYTKEKKNGDVRYIYQPSIKLKKIQKWILSEILSTIPISPGAHAFVKERSIYTNAEQHFRLNQKFWLYATDIKDFFDSISQKKVKKIFLNLGYSDEVSLLLSNFCCINNFVVQGFSTSPSISNIIFKELDNIFISAARRYDITYTRYADDLFFSGLIDNQSNLSKIKNIVMYSLKREQLTINTDKNRFFSLDDHKKITGLNITEKAITVSQKRKRFLEKEIYYCSKFGVEDHLRRTNQFHNSNYKGFLYGHAYFIHMVEPDVGKYFIQKLNELEF